MKIYKYIYIYRHSNDGPLSNLVKHSDISGL